MLSGIRLIGRTYLYMDIHCRTGLHIGSTAGDTTAASLGNPVVRHPISNEPYIPGSALRGKLRAQWERALGVEQNESLRTGPLPVRIHMVQAQRATQAVIDNDPVCRIFGVSGSNDPEIPTRLTISDFYLRDADRARMLEKRNQQFTEVKTEVSIDRITSQANPRSNERVPADAVFTNGYLSFSLYSAQDIDTIADLLTILSLLEDDVLGGFGSRGYGAVQFTDLRLEARRIAHVAAETMATGRNVDELLSNWGEIREQLAHYFSGEPRA